MANYFDNNNDSFVDINNFNESNDEGANVRCPDNNNSNLLSPF